MNREIRASGFQAPIMEPEAYAVTIGTRERAGFFSVGPLDFFLSALRLGVWDMIWCLREEMD